MYNLIVDKYGGALFEVARDKKMQDQILSEFELVLKTFAKVPELQLFINHPEVDNQDKKKVVVELFEDKISQEMKNFLFVVLDKRREGYLRDIFEGYQKLVDDYTKVQLVTITTTTPLDQGQKRRITKYLAKKLGTNIRLKERIDPSIIGGIVLDMEGKRLDRSISNTLDSLRYELTR